MWFFCFDTATIFLKNVPCMGHLLLISASNLTTSEKPGKWEDINFIPYSHPIQRGMHNLSHLVLASPAKNRRKNSITPSLQWLITSTADFNHRGSLHNSQLRRSRSCTLTHVSNMPITFNPNEIIKKQNCFFHATAIQIGRLQSSNSKYRIFYLI